MPISHYVECSSEDGDKIITYTVTLNDQNLPVTVVEEYSTGYKHTCTCVYNEFGLVARQECMDTDGAKNLYEAMFDANGNMIKETITDKDGNVSIFDITYNELNQQVKVVATNAPDYYLSYTVAYDEQGREIEVVYVREDETIIEKTTYNEAGNILQKTWAEEGGEIYSINDYNYDEKGRLVEILFTEDGEDGGFKRTTFNDKDQVISEYFFYPFGYEYTHSYEYDEHGNAIKTIYSNTDNEVCDDVVESTYQFVYLPFDFTEEDWEDLYETTKCWASSHW
jgi:YD repeat-containing protein